MKNILITGANGQLATCIQDAVSAKDSVNAIFTTREQLDVTNKASIKEIFSKKNIHYCINTAAYTNVEKAESEPEKAFAINAEGAKNVAEVCAENEITLIHVSTDYVFDGSKTSAYVETDPTNPLNVYGASKLQGEEYIQSICKQHFIVRTSWLYSQYGHNFLNTIKKHGKAGTELKVTTEQIGTPTNANALAAALLLLVEKEITDYGLYHFSNAGKATWYDFAKEILMQSSELSLTNLASTDHYRTFAKRPKYSVLDTNKIEKVLNINTIDWKKSLASVIDILETT